MDNITHSLIGVVLGRTLAKGDQKAKNALIWTAVLGSNLPDFDFFFQSFHEKGNLSYLLHHRGYTHTFLLAIPIGIVAAVLGSPFAGAKRPKETWFFWVGALAVVLHILMDWCNNYGVHPFFPLSNQWFYGDTLFILEPFLWFCLLPFVFVTARSSLTKGFILGLGAVMLGVVWLRLFNSGWIAFLLTLWGGLFIWLQRKSVSAKYAIAGILGVFFVFRVPSYFTHEKLSQAVKSLSPSSELIQMAASPAPGNPLCWQFSSLSVENNQDYVARAGTFSVIPYLISPKNCANVPSFQMKSFLTQVSETTGSQSSRIYWKGEFRRPLREFLYLRETSCRFRAFLKFSRIPFWWQSDGKWFGSDLRYERENVRAFSMIDLDPSQPCSQDLPPWVPPTDQIVQLLRGI